MVEKPHRDFVVALVFLAVDRIISIFSVKNFNLNTSHSQWILILIIEIDFVKLTQTVNYQRWKCMGGNTLQYMY